MKSKAKSSQKCAKSAQIDSKKCAKSAQKVCVFCIPVPPAHARQINPNPLIFLDFPRICRTSGNVPKCALPHTTRAVERGQASKVQIIETSDPLFATGFAFLLFGDRLSVAGLLGAGLIAAGLLIAVWHRPAPDLMRATAE
ncbi:EamA family transporter [Pandoraea apista]|uniref:EamA family transporter n=1 Tax=Pandoraea apista TaxID=93218 RepID=UPI0021AD7BAB|nr:DMT family transporter [Pandoraea apista]